MGDFDYVKVGRADAPEPFSVEDLFASMKDMEDEYAAFVGCFYGDPGSRKTTRAMKLAQQITPPDMKILYVYTGQGWSSLKNHPELMHRVKKMPFIRYEQIETLRAVLMNPKMRAAMKIGTVVFDEYNRMQDMDIDALTKHRAQLVNDAKKKDAKTGTPIYKDPDTPEWPEYNTTKVRMINLMNDVLSVDDLNTIFICHTKFQKKTGKIEPDFPQATASAFISMVHSIYYTDKVDAVQDGKAVTLYPIELVGSEQTVSKNRIGGLGNVVYDTEPIAEAFLKWNADVLAKRAGNATTISETTVGQPATQPVAVVEEKQDEVKAIETTAGPDDKDSIIAAPVVEEAITIPATVSVDDDFSDLFAS